MLISHWCKLIEGLQASPLEFYKSIVEAIDRRKVPGLARTLVQWPEAAVQAAVLEVVDKHLETNNLKPLTELERKPTLSALLMR